MIPIKATAKMGPTIQPLSPKFLAQPVRFHTHFLKPLSEPLRSLKISCMREKESLSDDALALELGLEIKKLNSHVLQREDAMRKSTELLFGEVCNFTGLKSKDLMKKWRRMNEEERWVLAKGFVAEWSARFHPLSAKSVKEMVEEHLGQQSNEFSDSVTGKLFPRLKKLFGFPGNGED